MIIKYLGFWNWR